MAKLRKGLYKLYLYSDYYYHYHTLFILDEFQNYFYYRKNIIYFGDNRKVKRLRIDKVENIEYIKLWD